MGLSNTSLDLECWRFVKKRGPDRRSGNVYCSEDSSFYLRTGEVSAIHSEAEFVKMAKDHGFPVPQVVDVGLLPDGTGYFVETSAGAENFSSLFRRESAAAGEISDALFDTFRAVVFQFLAAQLKPLCRQPEPSQLREGLRIDKVQKQDPDIAGRVEQAVAKAKNRMRQLPLVFTHGDLSPFNIMPKGIIDFEERFVAPAGYDALTAVMFQRFWDHPKPDGTGSMLLWDFNRQQISRFLLQADQLYVQEGVPPLSVFFDYFLMLNGIRALALVSDKPEDMDAFEVQHWQWRKRVALHCIEKYLADEPIQSDAFGAIGRGSN